MAASVAIGRALEDESQANRVSSRGARQVLAACSATHGIKLLDDLPALWEEMAQPLHQYLPMQLLPTPLTPDQVQAIINALTLLAGPLWGLLARCCLRVLLGAEGGSQGLGCLPAQRCWKWCTQGSTPGCALYWSMLPPAWRLPTLPFATLLHSA